MWRGVKHRRRRKPEPIEADIKRRAEIKAKLDDVADFFKYRPISREDLAVICDGLKNPNRHRLEAAEALVTERIAAERRSRR